MVAGGSKEDKNSRAAIALLSRGAKLGHLDALRELGYCLQNGYCVMQNVEGGRKLLERATKIEHVLAAGLCSPIHHPVEPENHPANRFLAKWFRFRPVGNELRLCSYDGCGRGETRKHEFRRCSRCYKVKYCSRCCQARDWKLYHKFECEPLLEGEAGGGGGGERLKKMLVVAVKKQREQLSRALGLVW